MSGNRRKAPNCNSTKMYGGTTASVARMKSNFDVLIGCRQSGQESPCLFNYKFDYVLRIAATEIDKEFRNFEMDGA